MTEEAVAACQGALAAGATEIWVRDAHGSGRNILQEQLPKEAKLVRGWSGHPYAMVQELDSSFDAICMVGYHGPAGAHRAEAACCCCCSLLGGRPAPKSPAVSARALSLLSGVMTAHTPTQIGSCRPPEQPAFAYQHPPLEQDHPQRSRYAGIPEPRSLRRARGATPAPLTLPLPHVEHGSSCCVTLPPWMPGCAGGLRVRRCRDL